MDYLYPLYISTPLRLQLPSGNRVRNTRYSRLHPVADLNPSDREVTYFLPRERERKGNPPAAC
jgi:hypothetical protein